MKRQKSHETIGTRSKAVAAVLRAGPSMVYSWVSISWMVHLQSEGGSLHIVPLPLELTIPCESDPPFDL